MRDDVYYVNYWFNIATQQTSPSDSASQWPQRKLLDRSKRTLELSGSDHRALDEARIHRAGVLGADYIKGQRQRGLASLDRNGQVFRQEELRLGTANQWPD